MRVSPVQSFILGAACVLLIAANSGMVQKLENVFNVTPAEVWVTSTSRSGVGGQGSQVDPKDASQQAYLQTILTNLPAGGVVHAYGTFTGYSLNITKSVRIEGPGRDGLSFTQASGTDKPIFKVSGSTTKFSLGHATLTHGTAFREEANLAAIRAYTPTDRIVLDDVYSSDFYNTILIDAGQTAQLVKVTNCEMVYTYGRASVSNISNYAAPCASIVGNPIVTLVVDNCIWDGLLDPTFAGVSGSPPASQRTAADNFIQTGEHTYARIQNNEVRRHGIEAIYLARGSVSGTYSPYFISGNRIGPAAVSYAGAYSPAVSLLNCQAVVSGNSITGTALGVNILFTSPNDSLNVVHVDRNDISHVLTGISGTKVSSKSTYNDNNIWCTSEPSRSIYEAALNPNGQSSYPCEFYGIQTDGGRAGGGSITADEPVYDATVTLSSRSSNTFTLSTTTGITVGGVLISYGGTYGVAFFPVTAVNAGASQVTVDSGYATAYSGITSGTLYFEKYPANFNSNAGIQVRTGGTVYLDNTFVSGFWRDLGMQNSGALVVNRHAARGNHIVQTDSATFQFKTRMGTATLSSGSVTVSCPTVTASTLIKLTGQGQGSNIGSPYEDKGSRVNGTSFKIKSTNASDTQTVVYELTEP